MALAIWTTVALALALDAACVLLCLSVTRPAPVALRHQRVRT